MDLKETLAHYRKEKGLSQIELAEALEVSRQTISKWETGTALPSAENLLALSRLYKVSVDALLNRGEGGEPSEILMPALEPEPAASPRRRLMPRLLAAIFLFDVLMFLLEFYLSNLNNMSSAINQLIRILGCCLIGLAFARWYQTVDRRASLITGLAALAVGLYAFLLPVPLFWRLYDWVAWIGSPLKALEAGLPSNPVFFFLGWSLFDECAFGSHMCLIAAFQLGRLWFSGSTAAQPQITI